MLRFCKSRLVLPVIKPGDSAQEVCIHPGPVYALDVTGLNVTVPHKSAVLPWLKEIDPLAEKVGAVNTLVRCPGGYKGYNTDLTGLQRAMESDGIHLKGE